MSAIIIAGIFGIAFAGFLVTRSVLAEPVEVPIEVIPIDEVPIEDIDQIEVIIPGNSETLITQIGF